MSPRLVATFATVLRWEGVRAAWDRVLDRLVERRRVQPFEDLPADASWSAWSPGAPPPVVNLAPLPPVPRRGGSQLQLLDRLEAESRSRSVALLFPLEKGWRLEWWDGARRARLDSGAHRAGTAAAAAWAATVSDARCVHLESVAGIPLQEVVELADGGLRLVLGVHDFSLFCRRPHLLELPAERFCGYCTDLDRCAGCLRVDGGEAPADQAARRAAGAAVLAAAAEVVYPSEFLRARHAELFPGSGRRLERVVPPATTATAAPPSPRGRRGGNVALVGGVKPAKGGGLLPALWDELCRRREGLRGVVLGGGDPHLLAPLRGRTGLLVRGYYRAGALPALLARVGAAVAVLPSVVPETYGLVVDECLAAGVPVVAFDHGAVADRLRRWGAGRLVPVAAGAAGLAAAASEVLAGGSQVPPEIRAQLPTPAATAAAMLELYAREPA